MGNGVIAFFAGVGVFIYVYRYFNKRATSNDPVKTITPAAIAGVLAFFIMLTLLWTVVPSA